MKKTAKLWLASSLLVLAAGPLQADNQKGSWSQLVDWPIIPIHAIMTPQGKIVSFGTDELGNQGAQFSYDVWDPESGTGADSHNTLPNTLGVDSFCSAAIVMPETGDILMAGGDDRVNVNRGINDAPIFRVGTETLDRAPEMASARWYPTSTILANGDVLLSGGYDEFARAVPTPEIYSPSTNSWRSLLGVSTAEYGYYYPRQWVAPNGKVFGYFESKKMFSMDTSGNGNLEFKGVMDVIGSPYDSTAVMYRPGKILHVGGSGVNANNQDYTNSAYQLDITNEDPVLTKITDPNEKGRIWVNSVVLPNGKVFIVGGSARWNELSDVATQPEIWNPEDGSWSLMAPSATARLYHSTALLLKDGRIVVGGGGAPGPIVNTNAEIYSPPYLFNGNNLASRPNIISAPEEAPYGAEITVKHSANDTITRATMVKTGAVTHSFNMDQRFVELEFTPGSDSAKVQIPSSANTATPGFYMLHLLNSAGVPSEAHMIKISSSAELPTIPPVNNSPSPIANADTYTAKSGVAKRFDVLANDTGTDIFVSVVNQYTAKGGTTKISNNKILYTASSGFNGTDSFWYTIEDSQGREFANKVTVTVTGEVTTPEDVYPTAVNDNVTSSGGASITIDALANDIGNNLTMAAPDVWSNKGGSVVWDDNKIIYTPKNAFNGIDKIWYVLRDSQGRSNSGEVTITVQGNDAVIPTSGDVYPTAAPDSVTAYAGVAKTIDPLANDMGSGLVLVRPNLWSLKGGDVLLKNNKLVYTAASGFSGTDKIWYAFSDSQGRDNSGEITIDVAATLSVGAEPQVVSMQDRSSVSKVSSSTVANESVVIDVFEADANSGLTLESIGTVSMKQGTISMANNLITYTPSQDFSGNDKIWFVYKNAQGRTYNGEVDLAVSASDTGTNTGGTDNSGSTGSSGSTETTSNTVNTGSSGGGSFSWLMMLLVSGLAFRKSLLRFIKQ